MREFCLGVLTRGDLGAKLAPAPADLCDRDPGPPLRVARPARDAGLAMGTGSSPLPRPGRLAEPESRVRCLARFAHHELMAAELFAWALLRWPELPAALRRGLLRVLGDEQRHCRLYVERLAELGSDLSEHEHSDYFWKHEPALDASPHGVRAFLCAMGLTLEQANLDFGLIYRDGFRDVGDEASARICEQVHADEVRHVRLAATWLRRLSAPGSDEIEAYEAAVPFPLGAARAKGRRFDADSRRRAGLGEAFVEHVRRARSRAELGGPAAGGRRR
ncbi:MAG: DUF455 family protein [Myxococcota bacterium]|nr:DUF455 family protein [Myxococcota bacterium]